MECVSRRYEILLLLNHISKFSKSCFRRRKKLFFLVYCRNLAGIHLYSPGILTGLCTIIKTTEAQIQIEICKKTAKWDFPTKFDAISFLFLYFVTSNVSCFFINIICFLIFSEKTYMLNVCVFRWRFSLSFTFFLRLMILLASWTTIEQ